MLHEDTVDDVDGEQECLGLEFEFIVQIDKPIDQDRPHSLVHIYLLLDQLRLNLKFGLLPLHVQVNLLSLKQKVTWLRFGL